jgi:hypothetical protein
MKHVPSITEKPPKEKKHRKPKVSKKKSSDDEDDKPQVTLHDPIRYRYIVS